MKSCAIYARVSDELQTRGESVAHQVSFLREYVRRKNFHAQDIWLTPDELIYCDEGISGTSIVRRAAVQALLRDAQAGKFTIVLFKGISRFARDTVDALIMLRMLQAYGLRVISFEENYDSAKDSAELIFTMHSAVAQYESEKIGIRVRVGNFEKARSGQWTGRVPDGYVLDPVTKRLQIDSVRQQVIERIFFYATSMNGASRIADQLNKEGLRTRAEGIWTAQKVLRILRNPVYVGEVHYGRRLRKLLPPGDEDPLARHYRVTWNFDRETIAVCSEAHPALVSRDTFARIQTWFTADRPRKGRIGTPRLLQGLLFCSCGEPMKVKQSGRGVYYYRCEKRARGVTACQQPYLRAEDAETLVKEQLLLDLTAELTLRQLPSQFVFDIVNSSRVITRLLKRVQIIEGDRAINLLLHYSWC